MADDPSWYNELQPNPEYQQRMREKEAARRRRDEELNRDAAPLFVDLKKAGVDISAVDNFVRLGEIPRAVPVLLEHVTKPYLRENKEMMARSLNDKGFRGVANKALLKAFRDEGDQRSAWVIGHAIATTAVHDDLEEICQLFFDQKYGYSRSELAYCIGRLGGPEMAGRLSEVLNDKDVTATVLEVLGDLKVVTTRDSVARFLTHRDTYIRQKARAALKKIDRAIEKQGMAIPLSARALAKEQAKHAVPDLDVEAAELEEASITFDLDMVSPFLGRVAALVSGFDSPESKLVVETAEDLDVDVDAERELQFTVEYLGSTMPLRIGMYKDDFDTLCLWFFTIGDLAKRLDEEMSRFCEEQGI